MQKLFVFRMLGGIAVYAAFQGLVSCLTGSLFWFPFESTGSEVPAGPVCTVDADSGDLQEQEAQKDESQSGESIVSEQKLGVGIERAWPGLRFDRPVHLCGAGDGTNRVFVVEQDGVVHVFDHGDDQSVKSTEVFIDIRHLISRKGNEEGLIGFAFHPDYKTNGEFFVHYSSKVNDEFGTLSRFSVDPENPNRGLPESEEIIFEIKQPFRNHNGGTIAFGKDRFLYMALGDGGKRADPLGAGQDLSTLLGKIIRIDVNKKDEGLSYSIPEDNPFVEVENARPEIWALGLRNVWRFSFDRKTGELWAGDVGQDKWDEVSLVTKGGNYGWNRYEANNDFATETELATLQHTPPVASYGREWGISITGGNVYRGKKFPELDGSYFYGDYVSGNLWRCWNDGKGKNYQSELVRRTGRSISAFGEDDEGELFLMSFDGGIYRIVPTDEPENTFASWPKKLSETGLFTSVTDLEPATNMVPYEVNAPFWSDGAEKTRYFVLPEGKQIEYRAENSWEVPVGTTLVKNFSRYNRRQMMESRLIKRTESGWESATYVWNKEKTEATLHPEGRQFEMWSKSQTSDAWQVDSWHAPSSSECASCHVDAAGYLLSFNTAQLNRTGSKSDKNQIEEWAEKGYLKLPASFQVSEAAKYCSPFDETKPLETRAKIWLDVNCAMCHRPDGPGNAKIDLRFATKLDDAFLIDEMPAQGDLDIQGAKLVMPGSADRSLLWHRIATLGPGRMPNLGTNIVDERAAKLIREWIESLNEEPDLE